MSASAAFLALVEQALPSEPPGIPSRAAHQRVDLASPYHVNNALRALAASGRAISTLSETERRLPVRLYRRAPAAAHVTTESNVMIKKAPNPVDKHVGARVRMRRMMLHMSQEKLGDALGLTFQQVQKYEKGTNRIGASRLQAIAKILDVDVGFFFAGSPDLHEGSAPAPDFAAKVLATADGINLVRAFDAIGDSKIRRRFVELLEQIAANFVAGTVPAE